MLIYTGISYIVYSILRLINLFSIKRDSSHNNDKDSNFSISLMSSVIGPLLTYMSNMMIICSSGSGVCTQIYMSTIASLLGAFGVSLSDLSDYLFPITIVLLGISVFSLYIKRKKLTHKPFLLGLSSACLIMVSHIWGDTNDFIYYLTYPGNILMISAAIWNARLNKFYGLPRYTK